jgi:hypothetical protein
MNLKAVQKLLGHSSITTTADIYTDRDIDQLGRDDARGHGRGEKVNRSRQWFRDPTTGAEHAPGRNRTCDLALRRRALYPLSYRRVRSV